MYQEKTKLVLEGWMRSLVSGMGVHNPIISAQTDRSDPIRFNFDSIR